MSRFLQHVLPKHFVKVRYYGFLSPRKRDLLAVIKELFAQFSSKDEKSGLASDIAAMPKLMRCPKCGAEMEFVQEIKPEKPVLRLSKHGRAPPWL